MSNKNTIHINGKVYDATTGDLLSVSAPAEPLAEIKHVKTEAHPVQPTHHERPPVHENRPINHHKHHEPAPSKILMRQAVKKPGKPIKKRGTAKSELRPEKPTMARIVKRHTISEKRMNRAKLASRSSHIQHFSSTPARYRPLHVAGHQPASFSHHSNSHPDHSTHHTQHHEQSTTDLLLEQALREATAHLEKPLKKPRRHLFKVR